MQANDAGHLQPYIETNTVPVREACVSRLMLGNDGWVVAVFSVPPEGSTNPAHRVASVVVYADATGGFYIKDLFYKTRPNIWVATKEEVVEYLNQRREEDF